MAEPLATTIITALGIGIALAGAPGPVQAVILSEATAGGVRRGLLAVAGASAGFGLLLLPTAVGLARVTIGPGVVGILQVLGGAFLLLLALDGLRSGAASTGDSGTRRPSRLGPPVRGSLAVLLNPGAWLFIATVAAPLFARAGAAAGVAGALAAALALMAGAASGDAALAVVGGLGLRRAGPRAGGWIRRGLAVVLAALGLWLIASGIAGTLLGAA